MERERGKRQREREVRFAIPTTEGIGMAIANITIQNEGYTHIAPIIPLSEDEEPVFSDDDDPQQHQSAIYHYLSHLLGELVELASN